ncbi:hypothetical protein Tco_0676891 [Tanacetum coccineum]
MANLEFCDTHNMVAYLKKPTGSEGFQEIVDFLNDSHIRYALTKNPTIYVSLIKKFWQTATTRTVDNGEQEITATVDGKEFNVTEASVRRHLQLADVDGISILLTTEIFDQLSLMGNMKRGFSGEHTPLFPCMLAIQVEESEGSGHPSEPQPPPSTAQPTNEEPIPNVVSSSHQKTQTPRQALNKVTELPQTSEPIPNVPDKVVYEEWDDRVERATTTAASLDTEQASGNINRTQLTAIPNVPLPQGIGTGDSPRCQEAMGGSIAQTRSERVPTPPSDSPLPRVHTLGSDEGSMTLQELKVLCTTLSKKVECLEADLKQTKQVYSDAYTKLIMKVKRLENTVKTSHSRRRAKIVILDDEEDSEDSSKQGRMVEEIDQDARVTLVTPTQGEDQPEDQLGVLSAAKVLADAAKTNVHTYTKRRRAVSTGSGGISTASRLFSTTEESISTAGASMPVSTAGMVQEVNISIPSLVVVKDKVEERNKYNEVDQAKMLVDLINQRKKYFTAQKVEAKRKKPMTQAQQRTYMSNYIKHMGSHTLQQLKRLSFDELKNLFEATMRRVSTFVPTVMEIRRGVPELVADSSQEAVIECTEAGGTKTSAEEELDQQSSKKQNTDELSQEELQQLMIIVPEEEMNVESLQTKYLIID